MLDLDETLVCASLKPMGEEDKQISVSNGTADVTVIHSLPLGLYQHSSLGDGVPEGGSKML